MNGDDHRFHQGELAFFGKTTASISHEIKNGLAVIKEESGLALDLMTMADQGRPFDPERIKTLMGKLMRKVDAVDNLIKDLNRFGHSVDDPQQVFDLRDALALAGRLSIRPARLNRVEIEIETASEQLQIENNPFSLNYLLMVLMEEAIVAARETGTVKAGLEKLEHGVAVVFSVGAGPPRPRSESSVLVDVLLESMGATIEFDEQDGRTVVSFAKIYRG